MTDQRLECRAAPVSCNRQAKTAGRPLGRDPSEPYFYRRDARLAFFHTAGLDRIIETRYNRSMEKFLLLFIFPPLMIIELLGMLGGSKKE